MRIIRVLGVAALFALPLSLALVQAQDPTATPAGDATLVPTTEVTMEATAEPTMEMTSEVTAEATTSTTAPTSAPAAGATAAPTTAAATVAPTTSTSGTTGQSTNGLVTCDSDLILNLYIAERFFGFSGVIQAAQAGNPSATTGFVDLNTIDKGQFTPWFTRIQGQSMLMPGMMLTQDQITNMGMMMTMDQTSIMNQMATMMPPGTDMSSLTTLTTASIAGEPQECSMLRAELNSFYNLVAFTDLQSSAGATGEATAEAGASTGATTSGNLTTVNFSTTMSGSQETQPADTDGTGTAAITVDMPNSQVCYTLSVQNITLPATAAHIHRGAVGVKGAPVVTFNVLPDASGMATSCVKADPALLNEIATNPAGFYVNVHNTDFPDGAVRGQVSG